MGEDDGLVGVFVVDREIPEIGAVPGDRIVMRPGHPTHPYSLVRALTLEGAQSAFRLSHCHLGFTDPPMRASLAYRILEGGRQLSRPRQRRDHLRLL